MSTAPRSKLEWFELLLSLDDAAQKRTLEEIRAQDAALARALEDLLAADAVLHQQQKHLALPEQLSGLSAAVGIAKNIAGFELLELLGQGGMGEVWLAARDVAGMRQKVALKLMRIGAQSDEFRQRFVREQRALLRLEHPNIARLIDAGVTPEGAPWIAMEYIEGDSLVRHCDNRSLSIRARLVLFRQVLAAVQFAHDHFLVHRDLKPDNIYVSARGEVKLLDFGIVKSLADDAKRETRPYFSAYAPAPEQLLGQQIFVTTDVYGLGGVLYELLSGSLLIDIDAPSFNWLTHAKEFAPRAPSLRVCADKAVLRGGLSTQALSALLRGELDRIVLHALRSAGAERYASARQFDQDIESYLEHRPVRAVGQSRLYLLKKFLQRHWLLTFVSAMSLMALISLSLMLFLRGEQLESQRNQALAQRQVAELAQAQAERATVAAEAANEFLVGVFKRANPLAETGADRRLKNLVEASFAEHLEQSKSAPLSATFLIALAQSLAALGENDKAQHLIASITTPLSRAEQFSIHILRAEIAKSQANTAQLAAEFALAKPLAQSAPEHRRLLELEVAMASLQRNHTRVVELLGTQFRSVRLVQMQVDSLMALGNTAAARALVDVALSLPALPKTQRPSMYEALVTLADREDHHDQALAWSEKSAAGGQRGVWRHASGVASIRKYAGIAIAEERTICTSHCRNRKSTATRAAALWCIRSASSLFKFQSRHQSSELRPALRHIQRAPGIGIGRHRRYTQRRTNVWHECTAARRLPAQQTGHAPGASNTFSSPAHRRKAQPRIVFLAESGFWRQSAYQGTARIR